MPTASNPQTQQVRNLERGLREIREIAFERGERIATLSTEVVQLTDRVAELEGELQVANQQTNLAANERINTVGRLVGQRIAFYGALMPTGQEVFGDDLQPGVTHTAKPGNAPIRSNRSAQDLREAVEKAREDLPPTLNVMWTKRSWQISVMKGTRRITAFAINYITSNGHDVFGVPSSMFKKLDQRKELPEVRGLLDRQAFMFGEGVDFNNLHSIVCQHARHRSMLNVLRYIFHGPTYVQLGHRNAHAKPSRAAMWGVTSVNVPTIALVLTMIYHVLLCKRTFWNEPNGTDYLDFYERRIDQLYQMQACTPDEFNSLIEWLNNDLFPQAPQTNLDPNGDIDMAAGENLLAAALEGWEEGEGEGEGEVSEGESDEEGSSGESGEE